MTTLEAVKKDILDMNLESNISQQKDAILTQWFQRVVETYPPETARFLKKESNQFANPVGHTTLHGLKGLLDEFLLGASQEKVSPFLDNILRIRAVQGFTPSQAVAFIFQLKEIVREQLRQQISENRITAEELAEFDSRVDGLALLAFDIYMQCREKLYEVRVNEVKSRTYRLLQRANLIADLPEQDGEASDNT